jgi:hypothetical protein
MMKTCIFAILTLIGYLVPCQKIIMVLEKDFGVSIVSFDEKVTGNLEGTFEDFSCRLELEIIGDEKVFKFFIKKRLVWDAYKLKFAGSGNWEADDTSIELRFESKKRNITNKYCIYEYMGQIYLVKMEEHASFFELTGTRQFADEERNMLYIRELLNNRFLVKGE